MQATGVVPRGYLYIERTASYGRGRSGDGAAAHCAAHDGRVAVDVSSGHHDRGGALGKSAAEAEPEQRSCTGWRGATNLMGAGDN